MEQGLDSERSEIIRLLRNKIDRCEKEALEMDKRADQNRVWAEVSRIDAIATRTELEKLLSDAGKLKP